MKRHGNPWGKLIEFRNLLDAAQKAARSKRGLANVARFHFDLERQLCQLEDELISQTYCPGQYLRFEIREPKPRWISATPFRDRIVHHTLCNVVEPIFERGFIHHSYDWLSEARTRCREYLKAMRLRLHPDKSVICPTGSGIRFLGCRVFSDRIRLQSSAQRRFGCRFAARLAVTGDCRHRRSS